MRTLAVFDIDGTLLDSVEAHQSSFLEALAPFDLTRIDTDWGSYPEHLDSAILHRLLSENEGRRATEEEVEAFDARLARRFTEVWSEEDDALLPLALRLLDELTGEPEVTAAFATGGFSAVSRPKMTALRRADPEVPLATATTCETRAGLVRAAMTAAGDGSFDRIVCVGDGLWDAEAADAVGAEFVGVGSLDPAVFHSAHRAPLLVGSVGDLISHPIWR